jgi:hypothetical protein
MELDALSTGARCAYRLAQLDRERNLLLLRLLQEGLGLLIDTRSLLSLGLKQSSFFLTLQLEGLTL